MNDPILNTFALNLVVAEMLVKDLDAEQMCRQPHGLINHPAWSLGHLVNSAHECYPMVGLESDLPQGWGEPFKAGTPPNPDVAANPSKDDLLNRFRAAHEALSSAFPNFDAATMATEHPSEGARQYFPTVGDHIVYMMTAHEMDHLGQMAAWRRAMGLPPAM